MKRRKNLFLLLATLIVCSGCYDLNGPQTLVEALNVSVNTSFFKEDWSTVYRIDYDMNPGLYVLDSNGDEPDSSLFSKEKYDLFEQKFAYYQHGIEAFINGYDSFCGPDEEEPRTYEKRIKEEYIFDFAKPYVWTWLIEMNTRKPAQDYLTLTDEEKETDRISVRDQLLIAKYVDSPLLYTISWYC